MRILPKLAFSNGHKQSRFEELDTTKVHLAASGGEYNEDVGKDLPDNDNSEIWSSQFTDVEKRQLLISSQIKIRLDSNSILHICGDNVNANPPLSVSHYIHASTPVEYS